jgi:hypothetical protein
MLGSKHRAEAFLHSVRDSVKRCLSTRSLLTRSVKVQELGEAREPLKSQVFG